MMKYVYLVQDEAGNQSTVVTDLPKTDGSFYKYLGLHDLTEDQANFPSWNGNTKSVVVDIAAKNKAHVETALQDWVKMIEDHEQKIRKVPTKEEVVANLIHEVNQLAQFFICTQKIKIEDNEYVFDFSIQDQINYKDFLLEKDTITISFRGTKNGERKQEQMFSKELALEIYNLLVSNKSMIIQNAWDQKSIIPTLEEEELKEYDVAGKLIFGVKNDL